ncbi:C40 family peptidase [Streptomyces sp. AV19]|uniref:C40 family peptidase n=1 Tax=Streptomyces sp. AV19 TaxID=2793068 RepID=UPI0018FE6572|nr:C40 family peptidase [Streptomyces sp. AV19]MBH1936785.1 C40 family peptidase [Streptomyces sp. AV19]MDG4532239.1 NlpC/P60 family protein [Streptomyces sp. AV19]
MASHRRPKQPSRTRVTVLTATAAAAVALSAQAAHADPGAKPTKSEAKEKVDKFYEEAEQATEKFNGAKQKQEKLEKEVGELQDRVARGQEDVNKLRDGLGSVATAQYRSGSVDPSLQLLLSSDPDSYLQRASTLNQVSAKQAETLKQISVKQRVLKQQREEAAGKLADLEATRKALGEQKSAVQGKLAEARDVLNQLTEKERAELEAQEKAEAAKSAAEAKEQAKDDSSAQEGSSKSGDSGSSSSSGKHVPASGRAGAALNAAASKIGSPYVWGATGPSSFDCSGLTSWAYAQAGVTLDRTSQAQANNGTRIYDQSQLQPGDLVIFYGDQHHVGLYAGNGQVLHAPRTGTVVRYEAMSNMPFQFGVRVG